MTSNKIAYLALNLHRACFLHAGDTFRRPFHIRDKSFHRPRETEEAGRGTQAVKWRTRGTVTSLLNSRLSLPATITMIILKNNTFTETERRGIGSLFNRGRANLSALNVANNAYNYNRKES